MEKNKSPQSQRRQLLRSLYSFLLKRDGFVAMPTQNKPTLSGGKRQWVRSKKRTLSAGAVLVLCLEKSPKFALSMAEIIYLTKRHLSAESLSFPLEVNSFLEAAEGLVKTKTILRLTIPGRADLFTLKKALRYYRQQ